MKRVFTLMLLLGLSLPSQAMEQTVQLIVTHMTCASCPITVRKALEKVDGVSLVAVDFKSKTATIGYDDEKTSVAQLQAATANAGYPSHMMGERP